MERAGLGDETDLDRDRISLILRMLPHDPKRLQRFLHRDYQEVPESRQEQTSNQPNMHHTLSHDYVI